MAEYFDAYFSLLGKIMGQNGVSQKADTTYIEHSTAYRLVTTRSLRTSIFFAAIHIIEFVLGAPNVSTGCPTGTRISITPMDSSPSPATAAAFTSTTARRG